MEKDDWRHTKLLTFRYFTFSKPSLSCLWRTMSTVIGCSLVSLEGLHDPVDLTDKIPFLIGRQRQFNIKEKTCSKNQVEMIPDFKKRIVLVKNLGANPAMIDSIKVRESMKWTEGQTLCLALDKVPYRIEFISRDKKESRSKSEGFIEENSVKRRALEDHETCQKKSKIETRKSSDCDDEVNEKLRQMRDTFAKAAKDEATPRADSRKVGGSKSPSTYGWRKIDTLLVYKSQGVLDSTKIAAFDMDGTIIATKSGRVFPTSPADWQILFAQIPKKLKELHRDGYKVVFLTNQLGISRGKMSETEFHDKVEAIINYLGCPVHLQAATSTGFYRKPALGSWYHLLDNENAGLSVDMGKSFYCGDAAGRPEDKARKRKKDHSCSDRLFALNIGLRFVTPEEYFLGDKPKDFNMPDFDPKALFTAKKIEVNELISQKQEIVVNVGFPASGKSHFAKSYLVHAGYEYVSRDELGTWQKCVSRCQEALKSGKSVVVDNTNPDIETRARYTAVAKANSIPCRCFYFPATLYHARHNEAFRQLTDRSHSKIPDMVMNSYKSKFVMPTVAEGFSEIVEVPFIPNFKSEADEKLYKLFLLEK